MKCLRCGAELHKKTCSQCGYTLKEGERIVSLFELDIDKINAELKKTDADVYFKRGHDHYQKGEYEQAIANFTTAIELDSDFAIAYYSREMAALIEKHNAEKMAITQQIENLTKKISQLENSSVTTKTAPPLKAPQAPADFVRIQGGTFMMGSPASEPKRRDDEGPQHQVTVTGFYLGKYAVTVGEFRRFVNASGYKTEAERNGGGYIWTGSAWEQKADATWKNPYIVQGDNHPVVMVSWNDAVAYCNWRSSQEGLTPAYTVKGTTVSWNRNAKGYRLPTEAEWEYACRAGTTTPFSTGGNITTDQANYNGNYPYNNNAKGTYRKKTTEVGSFAANPWGLYDMHGNVWEWCWDWFGAYSSGSVTDLLGASSGSFRVKRGGSWSDFGRNLRSAYRGYYDPSLRIIDLGFRLLRP